MCVRVPVCLPVCVSVGDNMAQRTAPPTCSLRASLPTSAAASTLPCALLDSPFMPAQLKARLSVCQSAALHLHPTPCPALPAPTLSAPLCAPSAYRPPPPLASRTASFRSGSSRMPDCRVRFEFCRTSCYGIAQPGVEWAVHGSGRVGVGW